jgi:hypothetical protein
MGLQFRRSILTVVVGAGLASFAYPGGASADEAAEIAKVREATAKYQDVKVALAEGFVPAPSGCISAAGEGLPAEWGAMGIHYIHPAMLKITKTEPRVDGMTTHTDFLKPSILLYEPQADGSLVLLGVENLVFQKAWKEAGNNAPPQFAGRTWDAMADDPATAADEAHEFEPHFDQHVWTLRENPNGALTPFNANVTCEHFKGKSHQQ